jgi:alpha-maltose-1-phosphate synthase
LTLNIALTFRLKIGIASTGRFHVLDLARELNNLGHEITFYSYVPLFRARQFGLPRESHIAVLPFVFPLVAAARWLPRKMAAHAEKWLALAMDRLVAWKLKPCDVFICMSGVYVHAALEARRRYGALIYVERGSKHVLSQRAILDSLSNRGAPVVVSFPPYIVARELTMYEEADRIAVPADHVIRSFETHGVRRSKLFRNPYGVDVKRFAPTHAPPPTPLTAIFVGTWSYRKGVDVLVNAWRLLSGLRLVHVGPVTDAPLPEGLNFEHYDPVDQSDLVSFYARAHLFVLASREEGMAMVQLQALSCGLPLVCTDRTGGEDLMALVGSRWIRVVPAGDARALAEGISDLLPFALALKGLRDPLGSARDELSWRAYGARYAAELEHAMRAKTANLKRVSAADG